MRTYPWMVFAGCLIAVPVEARTHRVPQIPHGNSFGCTSCHQTAGGGGNFTPFGTSTIGALVGTGTTTNLDVDWAKIYNIDSDRDGFTNGEELGDPNGTWKVGDPDPPGVFYHPGDDAKHPAGTCGDGRVTPPEKCDGANTNGLSCINLGLDPGPLSCDANCLYVTDLCGQGADVDAGITDDVGGTDAPGPEPESPSETSNDEGCATADGSVVWIALLALWGMRRRT